MEQPSEPDAERPAAPVTSPPRSTDPGPLVGAAPALAAALERLVQRAVLTRTQADAVLAEVANDPGGALGGRGRIFAEIAGYLGAAFVVGATFLYLGEKWETLGREGRFAILAAMAVVLAGSGLVVRWWAQPAGRSWWRGRPHDDARRRLASTLLTGGAAAAAFAVYVILKPPRETFGDTGDDRAVWAASLTALAVAAFGYLVVRSALGQLGVALAAFAVLITSLALVDVENAGAFGVGILSLGVVWAVLDWRRLLAERRFALAVAVTFGLVGAQTVALQDSDRGSYLGYVLTALAAAACFIAYARLRDWAPLAGGVVGATLVVPEFLFEVTDGSLGASGVMLVAGLTLLTAGLAGLRIRRTPAPPATGALG